MVVSRALAKPQKTGTSFVDFWEKTVTHDSNAILAIEYIEYIMYIRQRLLSELQIGRPILPNLPLYRALLSHFVLKYHFSKSIK